jgi:hypothetical protein
MFYHTEFKHITIRIRNHGYFVPKISCASPFSCGCERSSLLKQKKMNITDHETNQIMMEGHFSIIFFFFHLTSPHNHRKKASIEDVIIITNIGRETDAHSKQS